MKKEDSRDHLTFSMKAGYHTGEYSPTNWNNYSTLNGGFGMDFEGDVALGKGWFIGLNYDLWWAKGQDTRTYFGNPAGQTYSSHGFTPLIKYKFYEKNFSLYTALGLGGNTININTENVSSESQGYLNINAHIGFDYYLTKNFLIDFETNVYSMGETKWENGQTHNLINFKTGLSYMFIFQK